MRQGGDEQVERLSAAILVEQQTAEHGVARCHRV
jgi:hypothetical protein